MTETPFRPVIQSQTDLEHAWRHLMAPLGFGGASLWLMLIDADDRPVPALTEIAECDGSPEPEMADSLAAMLAHIISDETHEPGARWAVLRSRPGRRGLDDEDRAWAEAITTACRTHGVPLDVVHLATDDTVVPIPLDELNGYVRAS